MNIFNRILPLLLALTLPVAFFSGCGKVEGLPKAAQTEHFLFYAEAEDAEKIQELSNV